MLGEFLRSTTDPLANSYTMMELIEAFITMSSFEREELDTGRAHTYTPAMVRNYKYLQNRIYIGSIKLSEFLAMIKFDRDNVATAHDVIEVWKECAEKDEGADVFNTQRDAAS